MGVNIPETIKVLSPDFREFVQELASEVNRVSAAYVDLQRVRANEQIENSKASARISYFRVSDGGGPQTPVSIGLDLVAEVYNGTVFEIVEEENGEFAESNPSSITGYDLAVVANEPQIKPERAIIEQSDRLETGTVVMCNRVGNDSVFFSSTKPRLSVSCEPEEEP